MDFLLRTCACANFLFARRRSSINVTEENPSSSKWLHLDAFPSKSCHYIYSTQSLGSYWVLGSFISQPTMPMADLSISITWCLADASPSSLRADQLWPLSLLVRMHYAGGGCCSVRMNLINFPVLGLLIHIHHIVYLTVVKTWSA